MYEITKTGNGIKKGRYHKGRIIGRMDGYLLTDCRDNRNKHSAQYQLFLQDECGIVEKLDLTVKANRDIKTQILALALAGAN